MAEHIRDEYFVTRDVVTYNGSALVSDKKNLVVEVSYQLYVNGRGAGEMRHSLVICTCAVIFPVQEMFGQSTWMRNMEW